MTPLTLRETHLKLGANLADFNDCEGVDHYGDPTAEFRHLREKAALLDLSHRSRLCVIGPDRVPFLHGQVTNDIKGLGPGDGCLAALVDHKGKIQSDLTIHRLQDELLLDFEPGFTQRVTERLNQFIIAEDVEVVDVAPLYGLLSVQGVQSVAVIEALKLDCPLPETPRSIASTPHTDFGEAYLARRDRAGTTGFDFYVPDGSLPAAFQALLAAVESHGGGLCGAAALEKARILAAIPRYAADMDETNLVSETGIASEAISYAKGCYIGQEVIARIRTYGRAKRRFCRLQCPASGGALPQKGDLLFVGERKAGWITSATETADQAAVVALGYVSADHWDTGSELTLKTGNEELAVTVA